MSTDVSPVDYSPADPSVRLMPPHPLGGTSALSAVQLTDLGAQAASVGMERSAITGFVHDVQTLAVELSLRSASKLLERVRYAQEARLGRLAQDIKALPGAPAPGLFGSMSPDAALIRSGYVSREAVLSLIHGLNQASPRG